MTCSACHREAPGCTHELILRLTVPGEPMPKQPARILRNGHSYTPAMMRKAEEAIKWKALAWVRKYGGERSHLWVQTNDPVCLTCRFYRATGRTADLVKLVKDALNGVIWHDDRQVVQLHVSRFDSRQENPRTEICVYRILTTTQPQEHTKP